MRPNKVERKRELEFAVALRQKELEELRHRRTQLEQGLCLSHDALDANDLSAIFPVLEYCGPKPRRDLRTIPIAHVGSVLMQFELAFKAISEHNQTLLHEVKELNRRIKAEGKNCAKVQENTKELEDTTGVKAKSQEEANGRNSLLFQNNTDVSLQELTSRKALIAKEIRTGQLLIKKKEESLLEMANTSRQRQELRDEINALNNDIRVIDRDLKCEKEALLALVAEHDDVDARLCKLMATRESTALIANTSQEGIAEIRSEISGTVAESRQRQERVIKTQNYRIEQLEHRLECIEKALQNNHLSRAVDAALSGTWASKGELMTLCNEEDMYDADKINPTQERCHPAIYNLFVTEKDRLSRSIGLLDLVGDEKEAVIVALRCKAEALSEECQDAIEELDQVTSDAAYEEEAQRLKAIEYVEEQRLRYADLFLEKSKLKSLTLSTPRKLNGGRK
ncbi:hypothetical protein TraAM80_03821 [Trypanosoma rangeli]|uniref:Uncharacterized protein n=1 Tax=Trypanosoma rangeli TaxID=5698 RepID=A0A422NMD4_TRYRA|nr:uncharacterized protein TraAM80_03821 [Trypanosoma rangeli]RNF06625.1 hypothetical protein TraAM80_03821 [Trypanosoma rangeli]|eukprot:RNF06625.1 hypothetical protein TraAM80_03821 [Trypanosoma rangeli]